MKSPDPCDRPLGADDVADYLRQINAPRLPVAEDVNERINEWWDGSYGGVETLAEQQ